MNLFKNKVYNKEDTFRAYNDIEVKYSVVTKSLKEFNEYVEFFEDSPFKNAIDKIARYLSMYAKIDVIYVYIENEDIKLSIVFDNGYIWKDKFYDISEIPDNVMEIYGLIYGLNKETEDGFYMKADSGWYKISTVENGNIFYKLFDNGVKAEHIYYLYKFFKECIINLGLKINARAITKSSPVDFGSNTSLISIDLTRGDKIIKSTVLNIDYYMDLNLYNLKFNTIQEIIKSEFDLTPMRFPDGSVMQLDINTNVYLSFSDKHTGHLPDTRLKIYSTPTISDANRLIEVIKTISTNTDEVMNLMKLNSIMSIPVTDLDTGECKFTWNGELYSLEEMTKLNDDIVKTLELYKTKISQIETKVSSFNARIKIPELKIGVIEGFPYLLKFNRRDITLDNMNGLEVISNLIDSFLSCVAYDKDKLKLMIDKKCSLSYDVDRFPWMKLRVKCKEIGIDILFDPESSDVILDYINKKYDTDYMSKYGIKRVCENCRFYSRYTYASVTSSEPVIKDDCKCSKIGRNVSPDSSCVLFSASDCVVNDRIKSMIADSIELIGGK